MDRHVLRHVKLQSLDVPEQRDCVRADVLEISSRGRWAVKISVDCDLLLREVGDQPGKVLLTSAITASERC